MTPRRDTFDSDAPLSPVGEARRERMLADLQGEMRRRRRRRRAMVVSVASVPLIVTVLLLLPSPAIAPEAPAPVPGPVARATTPALPDTREVARVATRRIVSVSTRPGIALRLSASRPASRVAMISDDELLRLSAAEGQPVGIQRLGGVTTLVAHHIGQPNDRQEGDDRGDPMPPLGPGADNPNTTDEQSGAGDS